MLLKTERLSGAMVEDPLLERERYAELCNSLQAYLSNEEPFMTRLPFTIWQPSKRAKLSPFK